MAEGLVRSAQSVKDGLVQRLVEGAREVGQGLDKGAWLHGDRVLVGIVSGVLVVVAGSGGSSAVQAQCSGTSEGHLPRPPAPH